MRLIPNPILSTDSTDPENVIITHVEGVFAIDHIERHELDDKLYLDGNHMLNNGAPTFCYKFDSKEEYESFFPPVVVEEEIEFVEAVQPVFDVESFKHSARKLINKWYDRQFKVIQNGYPNSEVFTFTNKKIEALKVIRDPSYSSTTVDGLKGDMTAQEKAEQFLAKSEEFEKALVQIENIKNSGIAAIESAGTQNELNEIIGGFL